MARTSYVDVLYLHKSSPSKFGRTCVEFQCIGWDSRLNEHTLSQARIVKACPTKQLGCQTKALLMLIWVVSYGMPKPPHNKDACKISFFWHGFADTDDTVTKLSQVTRVVLHSHETNQIRVGRWPPPRKPEPSTIGRGPYLVGGWKSGGPKIAILHW